jgi:hypothetical protein
MDKFFAYLLRIGQQRAARELAMMGYYAESKALMEEARSNK